MNIVDIVERFFLFIDVVLVNRVKIVETIYHYLSIVVVEVVFYRVLYILKNIINKDNTYYV